MSDYIEYTPKRHGQRPPYWTPDTETSVDGHRFIRQPNWAWIAGTVYYVPYEAVHGVPRLAMDELTAQDADLTDHTKNCDWHVDQYPWECTCGLIYNQQRYVIEALTAENERLLVSNEQWQVDYNEAVIDKLELETKIKRLRGIGLHLVQHINWVTNGLPDLLEDACLTDEEGVINAAIAAATEARAALEKQP